MTIQTSVVPDVARSTELREELLMAMRELRRFWSQGRLLSKIAASAGISLEERQMRLLFAIARCEPVRPSDLATGLHLSLPAASRALNSLMNKGQLARATDPHDQRSHLFSLSERGRATCDQVEEAMAVAMADVMGFIDDDRLEEFAMDFRRMVDGFSRMLNDMDAATH